MIDARVDMFENISPRVPPCDEKERNERKEPINKVEMWGIFGKSWRCRPTCAVL